MERAGYRRDRREEMPVALNLTRKALKQLHQEVSGYNTDTIHVMASRLLQRPTKFPEGVRLEGHVNSVTAGETSYDSETNGWFSPGGGGINGFAEYSKS